MEYLQPVLMAVIRSVKVALANQQSVGDTAKVIKQFFKDIFAGCTYINGEKIYNVLRCFYLLFALTKT